MNKYNYDEEDFRADEDRYMADEEVDAKADESEDEAGICPACNGSGEGMHEDTRCIKCNGRGES